MMPGSDQALRNEEQTDYQRSINMLARAEAVWNSLSIKYDDTEAIPDERGRLPLPQETRSFYQSSLAAFLNVRGAEDDRGHNRHKVR